MAEKETPEERKKEMSGLGVGIALGGGGPLLVFFGAIFALAIVLAIAKGGFDVAKQVLKSRGWRVEGDLFLRALGRAFVWTAVLLGVLSVLL
jgi:hypothetical protein